MNVSQLISEMASRSPARVAVRFEGRKLTYGELGSRVAALAGLLQRHSVAASDRVAYLGPSCPELIETLFACGRLGAIFVPLNSRMPSAELSVFLDLTEPTVLLAERHLLSTAAECARARRFIVLAFSPGETWDGPEPLSRPGLRQAGAPVLISFTSGTTGTPKGAVLTHEALVANAEATVRALHMTPDDEVVTCTPMFHIAGLNLLSLPALSVGATVSIHRRFDPSSVLEEIGQGGTSMLVSPPHMSSELSHHELWEHTDLGGLRCVMTGGTTVTSSAVACWVMRGVPLIQGYGQTESGGNVTVSPLEEVPFSSMTAGRPMPRCEVRIADPADREVPAGTRGEVIVRGPSLMREYWKNRNATERTLHNGWLRTGDLGFVASNGLLHLVDRLKDLIIVGTSNVVPADLEAVLASSPEIAAAAVVGRPDDALGEVPVACVVRAPGRGLTTAQVLSMFDGALAAYKHPRDVLFLDAMPMTSVGKPEKKVLRAWAAGERMHRPRH